MLLTKPRVEVVKNQDAGAVIAADLIQKALASSADPVLGVATGSTPQPVYRELAMRRNQKSISFEHVRAFALDEYVGLPARSDASYRAFLEQQFALPVGMPLGALNVPDGAASDLSAECSRYESAILEVGGVDIQILGIGRNGHIGFNEPGTSFWSTTHTTQLAEETRDDNARFFASPEEVPRSSITQGLATIMRARSVVVLAWGDQKARAVASAIFEAPTVELPASVLQFHPNVTYIIDGPAATIIESDYPI